MGKIYSEDQKKYVPAIASQEMVRFLMSYSKSLQIIEYDNTIQFETNLN